MRASHGGSGAQARTVIDGVDADVVTLGIPSDIDAIAKLTHKIPEDWRSKLPNTATPYTSTVVFLVRKGNPKGVKDWADLVKPDVKVITPNPKTSAGGRWNFLAAWGYAYDQDKDSAKADAFVGQVYKNVPVLDTGARGSTVTFAQRGLGDVLPTWENEAYLVLQEFGADKFDIVSPPSSIYAEPPVALVAVNAERKGTTKAAAGLSRLPLHRPRPGDLRQAPLPADQAGGRRAGRPRAAPRDQAVQDRGPAGLLGRDPEAELRRRRPVRPFEPGRPLRLRTMVETPRRTRGPSDGRA